MRVLITNVNMEGRSGTRIFVRDLALELVRQGHETAVYTLRRGEITGELEKEGVEVVTRLDRLRLRPDIIHGHHPHVTKAALRHFPGVPAVYVCHNHELTLEIPPLHPRIYCYFGVSRICVDRVIATGVPPHKVHMLLNSVDLQRFMAREDALPDRPGKALLFSNYADSNTHLPAVREACRTKGLELDVIGTGVGRPCAAPERILTDYHLVFAKAKAALEAMATGAAVVLCDFSGTGPMVTSSNFNELQQHNFGFRTLSNPLSSVHIETEIDRYDAVDAGKVMNMTRQAHSLDRMTRTLISFYTRAMETAAEGLAADPVSSAGERLKERTVLLLLQLHFAVRGNYAGRLFRTLPIWKLTRDVYWRVMRTT